MTDEYEGDIYHYATLCVDSFFELYHTDVNRML